MLYIESNANHTFLTKVSGDALKNYIFFKIKRRIKYVFTRGYRHQKPAVSKLNYLKFRFSRNAEIKTKGFRCNLHFCSLLKVIPPVIVAKNFVVGFLSGKPIQPL